MKDLELKLLADDVELQQGVMRKGFLSDSNKIQFVLNEKDKTAIKTIWAPQYANVIIQYSNHQEITPILTFIKFFSKYQDLLLNKSIIQPILKKVALTEQFTGHLNSVFSNETDQKNILEIQDTLFIPNFFSDGWNDTSIECTQIFYDKYYLHFKSAINFGLIFVPAKLLKLIENKNIVYKIPFPMMFEPGNDNFHPLYFQLSLDFAGKLLTLPMSIVQTLQKLICEFSLTLDKDKDKNYDTDKSIQKEVIINDLTTLKQLYTFRIDYKPERSQLEKELLDFSYYVDKHLPVPLNVYFNVIS